MNDRQLRNITTAGRQGQRRAARGRLDITVASEIMAIFCLATSIGRPEGAPGPHRRGLHATTASPSRPRDLKAEGAMAALLKDALKPNLVQTLEGTPVRARRPVRQHRARLQLRHRHAHGAASWAITP